MHPQKDVGGSADHDGGGFFDTLLVVIAAHQRRESLTSHLARLGADVVLARREGQLAMLDAQEMLGRFMIDGQPDWDRFQHAIEEALRVARTRQANGAICAYGEMVGVLWEAGQTTAAIQLEEYWNKLLHCGGISLFCGYPIDVFASDFQRAHIHDVVCAHSRVLPTGPGSDLGLALDRAMNELLGGKADEVRLSMKTGIPSLNLAIPETESAILWLRSNVPDNAEEILSCARSYYAASANSSYAPEPARF